METRPFDAAEYLDGEEAFAAFLADAETDGPEAVADAERVVARARRRLAQIQPRRGDKPGARSVRGAA